MMKIVTYFNSINYKVDTGISFDSYYKIEIYDKIKKVVGDPELLR